MDMKTQQDQALQFCIEDFYRSFENAVQRAGGNINTIVRDPANTTMAELVDVLAQNGVRFTYDKYRSIDNVRFTSVPCFAPAPDGMASVCTKRK